MELKNKLDDYARKEHIINMYLGPYVSQLRQLIINDFPDISDVMISNYIWTILPFSIEPIESKTHLEYLCDAIDNYYTYTVLLPRY